MKATLEALGVYLPVTYDRLSFDERLEPTYVKGSVEKVNDYIAASTSFEISEYSAGVLVEAAQTHCVEDHLIVTMKVVPPAVGFGALVKRRTANYNRLGVARGENLEELQYFLEGTPYIKYQVECSSKLHMVNEWVRHAAHMSHPQLPGQPQKDYTSESTVKLTEQKSVLHARYVRLRRQLQRGPMKACWTAWRMLCPSRPRFLRMPRWRAGANLANIALVQDRMFCGMALQEVQDRIDESIEIDLAVLAEHRETRIAEAAENDEPKDLYKLIRPLYKPNVKKTAALRDVDGGVLLTMRAMRLRMQEYFNGLLSDHVRFCSGKPEDAQRCQSSKDP